jgi:hypothetical protein
VVLDRAEGSAVRDRAEDPAPAPAFSEVSQAAAAGPGCSGPGVLGYGFVKAWKSITDTPPPPDNIGLDAERNILPTYRTCF